MHLLLSIKRIGVSMPILQICIVQWDNMIQLWFIGINGGMIPNGSSPPVVIKPMGIIFSQLFISRPIALTRLFLFLKAASILLLRLKTLQVHASHCWHLQKNMLVKNNIRLPFIILLLALILQGNINYFRKRLMVIRFFPLYRMNWEITKKHIPIY